MHDPIQLERGSTTTPGFVPGVSTRVHAAPRSAKSISRLRSGDAAKPDLARLRAQADQVLAELLIDRDQSESRTQVAGHADPIRRVTGRSALDRAVEETRALLARIDAAKNGGPR